MAFSDENNQAVDLFSAATDNLTPDDIAIDCGANVGKFTVKMAESGARVLAYEPDENLMPRLNKLSDQYPNLTVYNSAVGVASGTVKLFRSPYYDSNPISESIKNTIVPTAKTRSTDGGWREMDDKNFSEVELVNLIELLQNLIRENGKVSLLKLDVEGAELEILEEMLRLDLFDNIDFTVAEMHGFRIPETKARIAALKKGIRQKWPIERVNFDWG